MLRLMKKDMILNKVMSIFVFIMVLILAPLMTTFAQEQKIPSGLILGTVPVLLAMMYLSAVLEEEEKNPKAQGMMTVIGYGRAKQVHVRFIWVMVFFFFYTLIYFLEKQRISSLEPITLTEWIGAFSFYTIFISLYLFLSMSLGVSRGRYLMMLFIMCLSLGPMILRYFSISIDLSFLKKMALSTFRMAALAIAVLSFALFYSLTVRYFEKKEL